MVFTGYGCCLVAGECEWMSRRGEGTPDGGGSNIGRCIGLIRDELSLNGGMACDTGGNAGDTLGDAGSNTCLPCSKCIGFIIPVALNGGTTCC